MEAHQIHALLAGGMGPDLHWHTEDVPLNRLGMTLVGLANAAGGTVLLGITPRSGHLLGVNKPAEAVDRVFQAALMADPPLVLPVPKLAAVGDVQVLVISVPAGLPNVYSLDGRYLGREGTQNNPLSARRLRQLLLERGVVQFEAQIAPGAGMDDLDDEQVANYAGRVQPGGEVSPRDMLVRRGCLKLEDGQYRPTYAGLLLFGRHPQQWLPSASILAARFSGATFTDEFIKQDMHGSLPQQLRQAELFIRENMRSAVRLAGLAHQASDEYPFEAVRELLVNAVAHRDYNHQGDSIHLNYFSDRLEVQSPGGLPGPVTLENLLEARFSRNAVVVQVLADLGFVERLGYGLDRVVAVMRERGLRPPRFEDVAGSFRVTLFGEMLNGARDPDLAGLKDLGLNPRQQSLMIHIGRNRRITNHEYQELCPEVHPETLRRDLADLVGRGLLIKVGDKRSTYYILK